MEMDLHQSHGTVLLPYNLTAMMPNFVEHEVQLWLASVSEVVF